MYRQVYGDFTKEEKEKISSRTPFVVKESKNMLYDDVIDLAASQPSEETPGAFPLVGKNFPFGLSGVVDYWAVADLGELRGAQSTPLWQLVMYFCVHNCTSPSNDYAAVACISNVTRHSYTLTCQFLTDLQTLD